MTKRFSLRFNLDNEVERKAWEHLQSAPDSKNKAIIASINAYFETDGNIEKVIRETIRECLKDISVAQAVANKPTEEISEDENTLMDFLDMFM